MLTFLVPLVDLGTAASHVFHELENGFDREFEMVVPLVISFQMPPSALTYIYFKKSSDSVYCVCSPDCEDLELLYSHRALCCSNWNFMTFI